MKTYRIVADFGFGDKTWLHRNLSEEEVVKYFVENRGYEPDTTFAEIQHLYRDSDFLYFFEKDDPNDVEDWDFESS